MEWGWNKKADASRDSTVCDFSTMSADVACTVDSSRALPVAPAGMGTIIPIQALYKQVFEFPVCAGTVFCADLSRQEWVPSAMQGLSLTFSGVSSLVLLLSLNN